MASTAPNAKLKEDAPAVNTGSIPNPAVTAMGPRKKKKKMDMKQFPYPTEDIKLVRLFYCLGLKDIWRTTNG